MAGWRKMTYLLEREQHLKCSIREAWEFFSTPGNLRQLTPESVDFEITRCAPGKMHEGQLIGYRIRVAPLLWVSWLTEITRVDAMKSFTDEQRSGPYKMWRHTHRFEEKDGGVLMTDHVTYAMKSGIIGKLAHAAFVRKKLQRIFDGRARLCEKIFNA